MGFEHEEYRHTTAHSRSDGRGYRARQAFCAGLLIAYPFLAFYGPTGGRTEFYPFFHWNLFAGSSPQTVDWVVIVHAVDGEPLPEPRLFFDMPETFAAARRRDVQLAKQVDDYARAYLMEDSAGMTLATDVIEARFLRGAGVVDYEIAQIVYDPLKRLKTGEIDRTTVFYRGSTAP